MIKPKSTFSSPKPLWRHLSAMFPMIFDVLDAQLDNVNVHLIVYDYKGSPYYKTKRKN